MTDPYLHIVRHSFSIVSIVLATDNVIRTGSKVIDSLLGGGIRMGMVTDVYGEPGAGKSQFCFSLVSSFIRNFDSKVLFVDTAGTFRPERIVEIFGSKSPLDKIVYQKALNTADQSGAIEVIQSMAPKLVIVDSLTYLFSAEFSGAARHLAVMDYLRKLALIAIKFGSAVVVTNMVRSRPIKLIDHGGDNVTTDFARSEQREFMGASVSIYSHMKMKFEIVDPSKSIFKATLVQPSNDESVLFRVTKHGVVDT